MIIGTVELEIHVPWVHSLKEKRMEVKSLCAKVRNTFNVSIAEVDHLDSHQRIVLGFACVTGEAAQADSIMDHVLSFIENHTDGEVIRIDREFR